MVRAAETTCVDGDDVVSTTSNTRGSMGGIEPAARPATEIGALAAPPVSVLVTGLTRLAVVAVLTLVVGACTTSWSATHAPRPTPSPSTRAIAVGRVSGATDHLGMVITSRPECRWCALPRPGSDVTTGGQARASPAARRQRGSRRRSPGSGGSGQSSRSMMVALAMPPPSHMVWRP